ncbi:Thiol-disulfide isomerase or thioredoxin [Seinonella peptonophila]|uniref:Thiol-disulfide isomerase or thioredoxin n=1 Tax=Seinonella peptonophila TaxID=112248 RepID=A0A1M4V0V9_9BACL|nr:redoxin domain-containing protein [Seinonella peptonophila]SHE62540.1 Thiol-disulfide isomerase or thioredoxin [Seinonella peptonophila]
MNWRNGIILALLLAFVGITVWYAWPGKNNPTSKTTASCIKESANQSRPEKGFCAPNFKLTDFKGDTMELYQNKGKPTFVNFWASWCEPCQAELPYMQSAYDKYKNRINFAMVNATMTEAGEEEVFDFVKTKHYTFPVYLDKEKTNIALGKYRVPGIPVTIIVNPDGRIQEKIVGSVSKKQLDHLIDQMLDQ